MEYFDKINCLDISAEEQKIFDKYSLARKFKNLKEIFIRYIHYDLLKSDFFTMEDNPYLRKLTLFKTGYKIVKRNSFIRFPNLKSLHLHYSGVEKIEEGAFNNLSSLEYLVLTSNYIIELDGKIFSPLKSLKYLNLDNNKIKKLKSSDFTGLINLKKLTINIENEIENETFKELKSLEVLELDFKRDLREPLKINDIMNYEWISDLKNLKVFKLVGNFWINESFFNFFNGLTELSIKVPQLKIKEIPLIANSIKKINISVYVDGRYNLELFKNLIDLERLSVNEPILGYIDNPDYIEVSKNT